MVVSGTLDTQKRRKEYHQGQVLSSSLVIAVVAHAGRRLFVATVPPLPVSFLSCLQHNPSPVHLWSTKQASTSATAVLRAATHSSPKDELHELPGGGVERRRQHLRGAGGGGRAAAAGNHGGGGGGGVRVVRLDDLVLTGDCRKVSVLGVLRVAGTKLGGHAKRKGKGGNGLPDGRVFGACL